MPTDGQEGLAQQVFREIERDFETLVRLIDRAIGQLSGSDAGDESVERLTRAKEAAELGAALANRRSPSPPREE